MFSYYFNIITTYISLEVDVELKHSKRLKHDLFLNIYSFEFNKI